LINSRGVEEFKNHGRTKRDGGSMKFHGFQFYNLLKPKKKQEQVEKEIEKWIKEEYG